MFNKISKFNDLKKVKYLYLYNFIPIPCFKIEYKYVNNYYDHTFRYIFLIFNRYILISYTYIQI